jgi:predicted MFS family arabinose efflux permease
MTRRQDSIEVSYGWVIVIASLALQSISLGAPNILFVALKPIAADIGSLRTVPSFAYSLMMIGTGVGGIAMGLWMDKRGIMQPVLFGAVMISLGAIVASQSEDRWGLYVANGLLIGLLGKAAIIAPLIANATRWFDRRRGLAIAIIASGQGVAGVFWPPVVNYLNDMVGWRETYLYFGIFAFATMVPLALLLRQKPVTPAAVRQRIAPSKLRILGLQPNVVHGILCWATVCCCAAMAMPIVHLVSHATDLGFARARAVELLSILFGAAIFSRIAFGMLVDRIGAVRTLLFGSCCQAIMLLAFAVVESQIGLYVAAVLFGLGFAGIMPCYPSIIRTLFPVTELGRRIAFQYLFASIGMALGGWLGGAVFDLTSSYSYAFLAGAGFNMMNLVLIGFIFVCQSRQNALRQAV